MLPERTFAKETVGSPSVKAGKIPVSSYKSGRLMHDEFLVLSGHIFLGNVTLSLSMQRRGGGEAHSLIAY